MELILTLDYELFGDGSGNLFDHVIEPTDRLLKICDRYDVKTTIFFEVLEYAKIRENWNSGLRMGYERNPAEAIESQLKEAYRKGHDIQLHLHPQWLNSIFNKCWHVDTSLWRLPEVRKETCGYSIRELLKFGRNIIEEIIRPLDREYRCNILRAGGHNILPSEKIVEAMMDTGFIADSSVYPGGVKDDNQSRYDFSSVKREIPYWWTKNGDVLSAGEEREEILEIPVFALPMRNISVFDSHRVQTYLRNRGYSGRKIKKLRENKGVVQVIKYYLKRRSVTWDFSLLSFGKMMKFYEEAKIISEESDFDNHPFVLIGHSKEFYSGDVLDRFFNERRDSIFLTLSELVGRLI